MTSPRVGKIWLKSHKDLEACENIVPEIYNTVSTTPEKSIKAGKVKSVTTHKKNKAGVVQIVANRTVPRKKSLGPGPQLGQLRIDSFFKTAVKSFKIDDIPCATTTSRLITPQKIKGRKRLSYVDSTTTTSTQTDSDVDWQPNNSKRRVQPSRQVKIAACTSMPVLIDLSDDELTPIVVEESTITKEASVLHETSQTDVKQKLAPPPMVSIPNSIMLPTASNHNRRAHYGDPAKQNNTTQRTRPRRQCPPYKIVEGTTFAVDAFQFGELPNVTQYFLTHYHADHYIGLTRKFAHPLYMSATTARLVRTFIPIDEQYIHELNIDEPIMLNNIEVTAIEANHCPGAIMLVFKTSSGKCILHTGDFRFSFEMESLPIFWNEYIDLMYLDTTYLSKKYSFCHQNESIDRAIRLVDLFREKHITKRILYVFGSYIIGKEKLWLALANKFGFSIWTESHRWRALDCLELPDWEKRKCNNPHKADLHILGMGAISYPRLAQYLEQYPEFDMLLAIRPSGWEKNSKPRYGKRISIIGIEYSEHSSYDEIERFVRFLKPKRVISTVPVGRNLFVTGNVPKKWYQYDNAIAMVSKEYQPSITSYFTTLIPLKVEAPDEANCMMMVSPLQMHSISNSNERSCLDNDMVESVVPVNNEAVSESSFEAAKNEIEALSKNSIVIVKNEVEMFSEGSMVTERNKQVVANCSAIRRFSADASDDMLI